MNINGISPNFKGLIVLKDYNTAYNTDNIAKITEGTRTVATSKGPQKEKLVGIETNHPTPITHYNYDFNTIIDAYEKAAVSPDTVVIVK